MAAGKSIMPPMANITSGKTSVCSTPVRGRLALGLGAGQRRGLAGERSHAAFEMTLGEQHHADEREDQQGAPDEQRRTVDGDRTDSPRSTVRRATVVGLVVVRGDPRTTATNAARSPTERKHGLDHVALRARERTPRRGRRASATPNTISSGESLPYARSGRGERRRLRAAGSSGAAPSAVDATVGGGSSTPTCCRIESTVGLSASSAGFG